MMEEDSWVCVDDGISSDENYSDSDKVDSETEAELYSLIHFEGNLSGLNCQSSTARNVTESETNTGLSDKMKYVLSTEIKGNNRETKFSLDSSNYLQNCLNDMNGLENCDKTYSDNSLQQTLNENEMFHPDRRVPANFESFTNSNKHAETQISKGENKRTIDDSLSKYSSPPKKRAGREIFVVDAESPEDKDIQINICDIGDDDDDSDIVFISSDSEADHSTPPKKGPSLLQNRSMPNIKIGESSKDLWFVNQEDICRARNIKSRRYHDKVDITCSNCNRKGHHNRICPLPKAIKCFICGGNHINTACSNRICGKCYGTGHDRRSCWMSQMYSCALCHMQGHTKENCPDLWRRYHLTTQPGKIVPDIKVKSNYSFVFCCKCGRPGHFGAVCNFEHRGYKNCFPTWPNVLSYDEPYSLPVRTPNTAGNKQKREKKDLVIKRKKIQTEAEKLARKERIKKRKQERKELKRQEFLNSNKNHKVLKERDFPRTPKNNPSSPRTPRKDSETNLFSPGSGTKANSSSINLSSFISENDSANNLSSTRTVDDDAVVILPTPKTKKNITFVDLTSPLRKNNNNKRPQNQAFNDSSDLPEIVRLEMLAQVKKSKKNRTRRFRRRQNRLLREKNRTVET